MNEPMSLDCSKIILDMFTRLSDFAQNYSVNAAQVLLSFIAKRRQILAFTNYSNCLENYIISDKKFYYFSPLGRITFIKSDSKDSHKNKKSYFK